MGLLPPTIRLTTKMIRTQMIQQQLLSVFVASYPLQTRCCDKTVGKIPCWKLTLILQDGVCKLDFYWDTLLGGCKFLSGCLRYTLNVYQQTKTWKSRIADKRRRVDEDHAHNLKWQKWVGPAPEHGKITWL